MKSSQNIRDKIHECWAICMSKRWEHKEDHDLFCGFTGAAHCLNLILNWIDIDQPATPDLSGCFARPKEDKTPGVKPKERSGDDS